MPTCTRTGCGKEYDETNNNEGDCMFHPGAPIFHEGLKGYTCCKKRVTSFEEFLQLPGCTSGSHSSEKVARPAPVSTSGTNTISGPTTVSESGVETYGLEPPAKSATPVLPIQPTEEKKPEPLEQDDPSISVEEGAKCRRLGCNATYVSEEVSRGDDEEAKCVFHPGVPIFHEGSKGYSCCKRRVLEFEEFLKIPGCTTDAHRFQAPPATETAKDEYELVQCREGFYQTQHTCVLSIFAKNIDKCSVKLDFAPRQLDISFNFESQKRYQATIPLYEEIDPSQSKYNILSMKLEITMQKANGASWPVLRPDPNITERITFGVDARC